MVCLACARAGCLALVVAPSSALEPRPAGALAPEPALTQPQRTNEASVASGAAAETMAFAQLSRASPEASKVGDGGKGEEPPAEPDEGLAAEALTSNKSFKMLVFWTVTPFGVLGADRFYLGFHGRGVGKMLSLGGCGFWYVYNVVQLAVGDIVDAEGNKVEFEEYQPGFKPGWFAAMLLFSFNMGFFCCCFAPWFMCSATLMCETPRQILSNACSLSMALSDNTAYTNLPQGAPSSGARHFGQV